MDGRQHKSEPRARSRHPSFAPCFLPSERVVLFAVVFGVYLKTLSPSIVGGDSGELVAEACKLGTAHPPGYPLFTLLTYAATMLLPPLPGVLSSPAGRANAMSAAFGALAAVFIHKSVRLLARRNDAIAVASGCTAALMYAFAPLVWQYSTSAEVFALNNWLNAMIVWSFLELHRTRDARDAVVGALLCGIAMTNQHTTILFQLPIAAAVLLGLSVGAVRPRAGVPRTVARMAAAYLTGLLPYAYLPIAAHLNHTPGSWGDVVTIGGLIRHIRRADYGTFRLYSGQDSAKESFQERLRLWLLDATYRQGFHGTVVYLAAAGAALTVLRVALSLRRGSSATATPNAKRRAKGTWSAREGCDASLHVAAAVILATLLFYLAVFHLLANLPLGNALLYGVHQRFWMQPFIIVVIFAGVFLDWALSCFISWSLHGLAKVDSVRVSASMRVRMGLAVAVCLTLSAGQLRMNFEACDQSKNWTFHNYAKALLQPLDRNSVLLVNWDQQWTSVRYMQQCEGFRDDVDSINLSMMTYAWFENKRELHPRLVFPGSFYTSEAKAMSKAGGEAFTMGEFLHANVDNGTGGKPAIYVGGELNYVDSVVQRDFEFVPLGCVNRIYRNNEVPSTRDFWEEAVQVQESIAHLLRPRRLPDLHRWNDETWESTVVRMYWDHIADVAAYGLKLAIDDVQSDQDETAARIIAEAAFWLEVAAALDPRPGPSVFKNLGLAYMNLVRSKVTRSWTEMMPRYAAFGRAAVDVPVNVFHSAERDGDISAWCSVRFLRSWETFLAHAQARGDGQYDAVRTIYEQVTQKAQQ